MCVRLSRQDPIFFFRVCLLRHRGDGGEGTTGMGIYDSPFEGLEIGRRERKIIVCKGRWMTGKFSEIQSKNLIIQVFNSYGRLPR